MNPLRKIAAQVFLVGVLGFAASPLRAYISFYVQPAANPVFPMQYAPGSALTFSLSGTPAGTHQWFHGTTAIPGATSATLTLTNLSAADSGNYYVQETRGTTVDTSQIQTINVLPFPPSPVDPTFVSQVSASLTNPVVLSVSPDESVLVSLQTAGGGGTTLVRLNADGTTAASTTVPSPAYSVLAALPDKSLIISLPPYRLHADFTPNLQPLPAGFDSTKALTAAAVQSDGKVLIAQGKLAARLNPDDTLDPSFAYSSRLSSQHSITKFQLDAGGRIYLYATERASNPSYYPQFWPVVLRLNPTGSEDTGFIAQLSPLQRGGVGVYPLSDGRLLLYNSYEGIPWWNLLDDHGAIDPNFKTLPSSTEYNTYTVDPVGMRIFVSTAYNNVIHRFLITSTALVDDPTFYQGSGAASSLAVSPAGKLLAAGNFTQWDDVPTSHVARLRTTDSVTAFPPTVTIGGNYSSPVKGSTLVIGSKVAGTGPFAYRWIALSGQPMPADTTSPQLTIANIDLVNLGTYQLLVTSPLGTVYSNVSEVSLGTAFQQLPYLANLSGRAFVGSGDNTAIAGLATKIYAGALGIPTLLRGAGPALANYGVRSVLPNPALNLYSATGLLLANNDNWGGTSALQAAAATTGAFPFTVGSNDAAMLNTFGTANTTLQLFDQGNASGVGLVEIYRMPSDYSVAEILNLSLRARTGPGENVATAGFVIVDPLGFGRPARIVLRVVGPTLSQYGVALPLTDPVLTLYRADGTIAAQNDNWGSVADPAALAAAMKQVGAFDLPSGSKDAAIVLDLPAGVYSLQATGASGTPDTGVALIEIYLVR